LRKHFITNPNAMFSGMEGPSQDDASSAINPYRLSTIPNMTIVMNFETSYAIPP